MTARIVFLLGLVCVTCTIASADSINSIPIGGFAQYGAVGCGGGCFSNGYFQIGGPGLSLSFGTPDGPGSIGTCTVGTLCNVSFVINLQNETPFCYYTPGCSLGTYGNKTADFLVPNLKFTGSAFYSGQDHLTVPMSVMGTIIGYQLVDCSPPGVDCQLGPRLFTVRLVGQGEGSVPMLALDSHADILGNANTFTGVATVVPEPASLILTGSGLLGVWMKKRRCQNLKISEACTEFTHTLQ